MRSCWSSLHQLGQSRPHIRRISSSNIKPENLDMDRPGDSQTPEQRSRQGAQPERVAPPSYRSLYLIFYNSLSALLWSVVLGRVLAICAIHETFIVYQGTGQWTKWTQTVAALEVVHAAIGITSANPTNPSTYTGIELTNDRLGEGADSHDAHAGSLSLPPRLDHRAQFPRYHVPLHSLQHDAACVVRHRSHPVYVLRNQHCLRRRTTQHDVFAL